MAHLVGTIDEIGENKFQWRFKRLSFLFAANHYPCEIKSPAFFVNNIETMLFASARNSNDMNNLKVIMLNNSNSETIVKFTETVTFKPVFRQRCDSFEMFKYRQDPENVVSIECEFRIWEDKEIVTNVIKESIPEEAVVLQDSLEELLNSGKFSDLTIVVEDQEFHVHKSVLASRSKVFNAMLQENTKEYKENKITIADIDCDTMKELLQFIYTAKVTNIEKMAYELVKPADKYEINNLLVLCDKTLAKSTSIDNIKSMLTLINLFNLRLVKEKVVEILQDNLEYVQQKDFTEFIQELSPVLLTEIIVKIIERLNRIKSLVPSTPLKLF